MTVRAFFSGFLVESWWCRDILVLAILALPAVAVAFLMAAAPPSAAPDAVQVLTLLAMAGIAAAAILVSVAGRGGGDSTAVRIGSALVVYGAVVLPLGTLTGSLGAAGAVLVTVCFAAVAGLLALALLHRGAPSMAWPAAAVVVAAGLSAGATVALVPALQPAPIMLAGLLAGAQLSWVLVAGALLAVGERVVVQVADDGPGVPLGTETRLTRRGLRGPFTGGGGIGLDISAALVREHGGDRRVLPRPAEGGFAVELELPLATLPAAPSAVSPTALPAAVPVAHRPQRERVDLLPAPRGRSASRPPVSTA